MADEMTISFKLALEKGYLKFDRVLNNLKYDYNYDTIYGAVFPIFGIQTNLETGNIVKNGLAFFHNISETKIILGMDGISDFCALMPGDIAWFRFAEDTVPYAYTPDDHFGGPHDLEYYIFDGQYEYMSSSSSSSSSEGNSSSSSSSSEEYSSESSSSEEFSSSSTSSEGDSSSSSTSYEDPITKTLLLDGTKYITMGDVYDYNSPSKKFGFAGWIKAANTTGNHCIVSKFVSNTGYKALIDDGKIALHIYKDASNKQIHASDNVVISANVWTHITFGHTDTNITGNVYDSTLYINGIEENMGGAWTGDVDTFTSVANLEIGRSGDNDEFFEGNITNLVWFDNYTPTQADATNLFNSGEFLYPSTVTSVYVNVDNYWALDDRDISELNTITDIKGVYDGTAVNITLTDFEEDIP